MRNLFTKKASLECHQNCPLTATSICTHPCLHEHVHMYKINVLVCLLFRKEDALVFFSGIFTCSSFLYPKKRNEGISCYLSCFSFPARVPEWPHSKRSLHTDSSDSSYRPLYHPLPTTFSLPTHHYWALYPCHPPASWNSKLSSFGCPLLSSLFPIPYF